MKISPQTKSFIILIIVASVGTYACLILWGGMAYQNAGFMAFLNSIPQTHRNEQSNTNTETEIVPPRESVNTTGWKTYENKDYHISFKYDPSWKVLKPKTQNGFTVIEIDPGKKFFNLKVYISDKSYYILDGLPTKEDSVGGQKALNVNYALYGVNYLGTYYTFDIGWSMSLVPEFDALVHSVAFAN